MMNKEIKTNSIHIVAETLPEAWEQAVLKTWEVGDRFKTEYDKPGDPESRDCIATLVVTEPMKEPRIHRAFPGGLNDLETYKHEVVNGVKDHWINPAEGKWEYTYHERFADYRVPSLESINQIDKMIDKLAEAPHTRRAQAVTWQAWNDINIGDPACLQRIWCRVYDDKLRMNIHIRSNDAYKAAFMNMYGFVALQEKIAEDLSEKLGKEIKVGQYTHMADSFHIYGSYFDEFKGFLKSVEDRTFEQRVFDSRDEIVQGSFKDGLNELLAFKDDKALPADKRKIVEKELKKYD